MWALTVWALLASVGVIVLSAKLWLRIEERERQADDADSWGPELRLG